MALLSHLGPWSYPLAALGLATIADAIRAAVVIGSLDAEPPASGAPHHTVLAWGVLGGLVGLLGTAVGLGRLVLGIRSAVGPEPEDLESMLTILGEGIATVLSPAVAGGSLLAGSLVAWLALQYAFTLRVR